MKTYQAHYNVAYEGWQLEEFLTKRELINWLEEVGPSIRQNHGEIYLFEAREITLEELNE